MKSKKIAFTGIPVTDIKRAQAFYEGVLGLNTRSGRPARYKGYPSDLTDAPVGADRAVGAHPARRVSGDAFAAPDRGLGP